MDYEIEKGIPVPVNKMGPNSIYPFIKMERGDSFKVIPGEKQTLKQIADCVRAAAYYYHNHINNKARFSVKVINKTFVRCWRIR